MLIAAFTTTSQAILELIFLGLMGFLLVRRRIISQEGLRVISGLVIGLFLPFFMFSEITRRFSFSLYPDWWIFPLLSVLMTAVGYLCGLLMLKTDKRLVFCEGEFLGVASFQNSGYLPLPLVASLLSPLYASEMFIYIFLFLLGFNMTIFSFGVYLLACKGKACRFDYKDMFNAPVIATLLALVFVFLKINLFIPGFISKPVDMLGRCAIPLSILVVGANLASMNLGTHVHRRPIRYALLIKLIVLPVLFLAFILLIKPKPLVGLLLLLQAAMPPAALLSVISKNQNASEELVSQSIFYGHLISIITIPLFLALYWILAGPLP